MNTEHDTIGRPTALDAERIVIGSAMAQPDLIDDLAMSGFHPDDFSSDQHRWIWRAIEEIRATLTAGEIRWAAVERQLKKWHADSTMPIAPLPTAQLAALYDEAQPASADYYAADVSRAAVAGRIVTLGIDARIKGMSPAFDEHADVAALQTALDNIVRPSKASEGSMIGDLLGRTLERMVTPPVQGERIKTGLVDLDGVLNGGLAPGQLCVIGARPAMGKTTFAAGLARTAAIQHGHYTLFRSLEMSEDELSNGILCAEARIPLHHLKAGEVDDAGIARAAAVAPKIDAAPLHIVDTPGLSLPELRAQVRHLTRTRNLRLVVIDYLQLMEAPRAESRQVAVAALSRGLKLLAKEFQVAVVVLAQVNRGPEQRQDKLPTSSDLRESGAIEADADVVLLLHRPDAYEKESPRAGEADIIVDKNRGGVAKVTVTAAFQGHYCRFVDMAGT